MSIFYHFQQAFAYSNVFYHKTDLFQLPPSLDFSPAKIMRDCKPARPLARSVMLQETAGHLHISLPTTVQLYIANITSYLSTGHTYTFSAASFLQVAIFFAYPLNFKAIYHRVGTFSLFYGIPYCVCQILQKRYMNIVFFHHICFFIHEYAN